MENIYARNILSTKIQLRPDEFNNDIDNKLLFKLKKK